MVTSVQVDATRAGLEIMRAGGNAVDASVAVGFALAVTHPQAGNIGGGGFLLVRFANGDVHFLDYREKAPAAATERRIAVRARRLRGKWSQQLLQRASQARQVLFIIVEVRRDAQSAVPRGNDHFLFPQRARDCGGILSGQSHNYDL